MTSKSKIFFKEQVKNSIIARLSIGFEQES